MGGRRLFWFVDLQSHFVPFHGHGVKCMSNSWSSFLCRCAQMEEDEEDEKGVHSEDLVPCRTRYAKLYRAAPPRCLASLRISKLIHLDPNAFYSDSHLRKSHRILNPESSRSCVEPHLERGTSPEIRRPHAKIHPPTFSISHSHARQAASRSYRDSSQRQRQR